MEEQLKTGTEPSDREDELENEALSMKDIKKATSSASEAEIKEVENYCAGFRNRCYWIKSRETIPLLRTG